MSYASLQEFWEAIEDPDNELDDDSLGTPPMKTIKLGLSDYYTSRPTISEIFPEPSAPPAEEVESSTSGESVCEFDVDSNAENCNCSECRRLMEWYANAPSAARGCTATLEESYRLSHYIGDWREGK